NFSLQGVADATLSSQGDIQLQGVALQAGHETGSLLTAGNLTLRAERVYPDTFTDFSIQAPQGEAGAGTVRIDQVGASPGTPLSADGSIRISAGKIVIGGTLLAPFGKIDLAASDSLELLDHSMVSVSGAGIQVPFGQTRQNGAQWVYHTSRGDTSI